VETDAKYLAGMLRNPGMGPNATINRWIDKILMFHKEKPLQLMGCLEEMPSLVMRFSQIQKKI